ncbi:MAG: type II secretion system minor pseudopilin GspK [Sulfuricaulis sp.]
MAKTYLKNGFHVGWGEARYAEPQHVRRRVGVRCAHPNLPGYFEMGSKNYLKNSLPPYLTGRVPRSTACAASRIGARSAPCISSNVPRRERGVALITAMLVVAIAATVAAYVSLDQQVWLRQAQNLSDRAQAEVVRAAAEEWAITLLDKDAKNRTDDDLTQNWAKGLPPIPVEGGQLTGQIMDAQGRFNINNLVLRNSASDKGVFRNLLEAQSIDPNLINAVMDWIDPDSDSRTPDGAEDIDYLQLPTPYRTANQPMQSVDELRLVHGFTPAMVEKLRPFLTALPQATSINVNTAPPEVLSALFSLPVSAIDPIISGRPYKSASEIATKVQPLLGSGTQMPQAETYGTASSYFYVNVDTLFGRYRGTTQTLIKRTPGATSQVLWHSRRLPADVLAALNKAVKKADTSAAGKM